MTTKTEQTFEKIYAVTGQLETTLETLAKNPNGSPAGKEQAQQNLSAVKTLNQKGHAVVAAATATQSQSSGFGLGGSSSSRERG